jgi:hypothetical protein
MCFRTDSISSFLRKNQTMLHVETKTRVEELRTLLHQYKPPKPDPDLKRDLQPGWLMPYLLKVDAYTWGRWDYWFRTNQAGKLLDECIPQISFDNEGLNSSSGKHLQRCLDLVSDYGSWKGWDSWKLFDYLMDWLLYGFGHPGHISLPQELSLGASMRLYQFFDLHWLMLYPYDYWGSILSENAHGRHLGFYPTPHPIVELMCRMNFAEGEDSRLQKVHDPCLGNGRMLLHASNFSLSLNGMDINETVIKASLVNGYLYAPWLVKPFPFLDSNYCQEASSVPSEKITQASESSNASEYISETASSPDQAWKYEPIKKRRSKGHPGDTEKINQGLLF